MGDMCSQAAVLWPSLGSDVDIAPASCGEKRAERQSESVSLPADQCFYTELCQELCVLTQRIKSWTQAAETSSELCLDSVLEMCEDLGVRVEMLLLHTERN